METRTITDEYLMDFIDIYCEGKGALWNLLYGWRKSNFKVTPHEYTYTLSKDMWRLCEYIANKHREGKTINGNEQ